MISRQPALLCWNLTQVMALWIILIIALAAILVAGISLYRIAGYAERKVRHISATRLRRRDDEQAA